MKKILTAIVLIISAGTASAADMPRAAPYQKAPVVSPAYNWTGFYIGAMGGYGWSDEVRATIGGLTVSASSNDLKGGFAGGTVGYNWQTSSNFVVGVEADAAWSDIKYSETAFGVTLTDKIQSFGSVAGRIGFAASAALFYVKAGYAWANNEVSASALGASFAESRFHSGWTAGGGLEYLFTPDWSGKVEYMYADYSNADYLAAFGPGRIGLGVTVNTVKAGVNYHFGGPVVARY